MPNKFEVDPLATKAYTFAHGETLFTHMKMIHNQLSFFGIRYEGFVVSPRKALASNDWSRYEKLVDHHGVKNLSTSGACTVLAIRASTALEKDHPSKYDFKMYNVGRHRICRCLKTFVVIDSTSRNGAEIVPPGKEWPYGNNTFVWNANGHIKKTTAKGEPKKWISFEEGLATCLWEIAETVDLITLFRLTNEYGKRWTEALLWWVIDDDSHHSFAAKYLVLERKRGDENPQRVKAVEALVDSDDKLNSPKRRELWEADDCRLIHEHIWKALVKKYGFPVLKQGKKPDSYKGH
ncbi:hypothetical protein FCIRC_12955 [Fusarium circinatum]|uniref:Uncharacterized protein n=1 Tax=Fusarium circinatum TaxID=48490 RepID=A0A8H5SV94_FUSCI|nr:hypothetical protein FCIRC_12955 [Fusarium circinatum]